MAEGFFGELGEKAGYPFRQINPATFKSYAGGYGLATLCGSLGVAAVCIGSVVPPDDAKKLIAELFNWYKDFSFPEYQPEYEGQLKKTVAESYLCSDSVGKFMHEMNVGYKDPIRKARCAGTAADTTRKMVEILNKYHGV
ncbi:Split-Soret cytochrome c [Clostridiaceae bacterium JG1575]|nr:Split-Soret cytochrome c [Clostridiaceae bacterium JG1575]